MKTMGDEQHKTFEATPAPAQLVQAAPSAPEWKNVPGTGSKLNLGCGPNILAGWKNMDLEPGAGAEFWDATRGIPCPSETVAMIYSEHFIEHMSLDHVRVFLGECYRVLVPGGILRFSTPDLVSLIKLYLRMRTGEKFANQGYVPETPCDLINDGMRRWGHQYVFDKEKMRACLMQAGFHAFAEAPWRQSTLKDLTGLETRPFNDEIIVEAQKSMVS